MANIEKDENIIQKDLDNPKEWHMDMELNFTI